MTKEIVNIFTDIDKKINKIENINKRRNMERLMEL